MKLTKIKVEAKPRVLSHTWTIEEAKLGPSYQHISKDEVKRRWKLQTQGTVVPVFDHVVSNHISWCGENCKADYDWRRTDHLISDEEYKAGLLGEDGLRVNVESVEDEIYNLLNMEIEREIEDEILRALGHTPKPKPSAWFFFESKDDGLLFKLVWGGDNGGV